MAAWIHDQWPSGMIDLKPRSTSFGAAQLSERDQCILQISEDLVRVAPLILGFFPPGFSRLGLQFISGSLAFYPHRLYESGSSKILLWKGFALSSSPSSIASSRSGALCCSKHPSRPSSRTSSDTSRVYSISDPPPGIAEGITPGSRTIWIGSPITQGNFGRSCRQGSS